VLMNTLEGVLELVPALDRSVVLGVGLVESAPPLCPLDTLGALLEVLCVGRNGSGPDAVDSLDLRDGLGGWVDIDERCDAEDRVGLIECAEDVRIKLGDGGP